MRSWLCSLILKWWGWKINGSMNQGQKKSIVLAIPHTSNWDFPIGILLRNKQKIDVGFFIKNNFMKPPLSWFLKWLGAVPVDRSKSNNMVDAMVEAFNTRETLNVNIAPEGTRKKVDKLKTGFYYIALKSNVPLVLIKFDWGRMTLDIDDLFYVTGDIEKDMAYIDDFFRGAIGYIPEYGYLYEE